DRLVTTYLPISPLASPTANGLEHVRIIALHDGTNIKELAERLGVSGVSVANRRSLRRLHGAFMTLLANKGVAIPVMAWDIAFREDSEFDQDFIRGAEPLKQRGADIILA